MGRGTLQSPRTLGCEAELFPASSAANGGCSIKNKLFWCKLPACLAA